MQRYSQIKMDMFPKKEVLINTRKNIVLLIEESIANGVEEFPELLIDVYNKCKSKECIPTAYSEEYYLKLLVMLLIYKDKLLWAKKSLNNISSAGIFAGDRSIREYADRIWGLKRI